MSEGTGVGATSGELAQGSIPLPVPQNSVYMPEGGVKPPKAPSLNLNGDEIMSIEIWILAGFMLLALLLIIGLWARLSELQDDLREAKRKINEHRNDYYDMRDDYWKLSHRLDDLGLATGHVYKQHDAYHAWEKQS